MRALRHDAAVLRDPSLGLHELEEARSDPRGGIGVAGGRHQRGSERGEGGARGGFAMPSQRQFAFSEIPGSPGLTPRALKDWAIARASSRHTRARVSLVAPPG